MVYMYSVVIPVYNSEAIIAKTALQVRDFFVANDLIFEIILVNDGSGDNSWIEILNLAHQYKEITAVNLLRNYGQHHANLCGFRQARGDFIITMDDDLQNPPSELGKLIDKANEGHDLVIGKFETKQHSTFRKLGSKFVGWLNRKIFEVNDDLVLTNFRIIRRDIVERICVDKSHSPYIPGLILKYSSSKRCNVLVRHQPRDSGKSNYTLFKLFRLVATILFNHSSMPMRAGAFLGFVISGGSFLLGFVFLITAMINGTTAPGWASIVVLLSFFNGILILLISIIGEYLIRLMREVSTQQSYEIVEVVRQ